MSRLFTFLTLLSIGLGLFAQVPGLMSYQAVIRNSNNQLVTNQPVGIRISILQGTSTGNAVYQEMYYPLAQTNSNGLVTIEIGGGVSLVGSFEHIDWSAGPYFLMTETDPSGGTNYTITGTSQILSVPYALYAEKAGNGFSGDYNELTNQPDLFDGDWVSLTGTPTTLEGYGITDAFDGSWENLIGKPNFSSVATSGNYTDLINKPSLFDGNYNNLSNKPALFDGNYNSLNNKPDLNAYATKDMSDQRITNLGDPVARQDAANKAYVDEVKNVLEKLNQRITALEGDTVVPHEWAGKVMTVHGLMPADSMGITLPHEHLLIKHKGPGIDLESEPDAISELNYFANAGGKTLTEVTNIGIFRNPEGLKRISTATGVNVIMGSGFYKDMWVYDHFKQMSVEQLTDIIIGDIKNGINGIHAGVIGEIGVSRPMTVFEEKVIVAAARAQKATGAAIIIHFDISDDPIEKHYVMNVMENEGADLSRVSISHNTPYLNQVDDFVTYAQRGAYVAFDMFGLEVRITFQPPLEPVQTIKALIDKGYIEHILISQDVCFTVCYVKNGGFGYAHILKNIVPQLKAAGITDAQTHTIMVENPKRLLTFK